VGTGRPLEQYALRSQSLRALQAGAGSLARLPIPLPHDYVAGLDAQRAVMEQAHPIFLDGEWSLSGFRSYFLRTLQYKLPHVLQLFVATGLLTLLATAGQGGWRRVVVLWLPSALLIGIASLSSMQLGVRYILPALPLLILTASSTAQWLGRAGVVAKSAAFVVVAVACGLSLRHHPHHLAYFNELAGGPIGGRYHLLDSNIDWGQDLHLVKEFMQREGLDRIGLVYFGTLPGSVYGINFVIPPGWRPAPGWHAVSVNYVMGRPHTLAEPDHSGRASDLDEFAYFQQFEPVARLGYSIDVYHIPE
jgi:hypothetical protein